MPRKKQPETVADIEVMDGEESPSISTRARRFFGLDHEHPDAKPKARPRIPAGHPDETDILELVALADIPVAVIAPRDSLTPWETQKLVSALHTYSQKDERARRWMYGISQKSALLTLLNTVLVTIAVPRLIRHGLLPPQTAVYFTKWCDPVQLADSVGMEPEQFAAAVNQVQQQPAQPSPNGVEPLARDEHGVPV